MMPLRTAGGTNNLSEEHGVENNGMGYISGDYASKTFTSFSHSISELVNSTIQSGMSVKLLNEYDYDIGLSDVYDAMAAVIHAAHG